MTPAAHPAKRLKLDLLLGLAMRGAGAVSSFALLWLVARIFGVEVVGQYQLGLTTAVLASLFVSLGLDILLVRETGALLRAGQHGDARATYLACRRHILRVGLPASLLFAAAAVPFSRWVLGEPEVSLFLLVLAPTVLLQALLKLGNALLRTQGKVLLSQSLEGVFFTTIAAVILALAWTLGETGVELLPAIGYLIGMVLATALSVTIANRQIAPWPAGESCLRISEGIPVVAAPIISQAGNWLMLLAVTTMLGLGDAGIYRVAFQVCMLFQLVNASFAIMAGPHLARAAAEPGLAGIRRITLTAGTIGLGLCLPLTVLGLAAPAWILGLFGEDFREGALALQILVVAQTINVALGPVGTALVMLRRAKQVLWLELAGSVSGVILAIATIERFGLAGVATGVLLATVVCNVGNFIGVQLAVRSARTLAAPQKNHQSATKV